MGGGFWVGGWVLLVGAVLCAISLSYVFGGAHPPNTTESVDEMHFHYQIGFLLALVFMAPTLILFWWDPVWFTGLGAILGTFGAFLMGVGANYFLHSYFQPLEKIPHSDRHKNKKNTKGESTNKPKSGARGKDEPEETHDKIISSVRVNSEGVTETNGNKDATGKSSPVSLAPEGPADFSVNAEVRLDWARALAYGLSQKGPRESLQKIGLFDAIRRLINLLKMETPSIVFNGHLVPVRFILPGVTDVPAFSPSKGNNVRVRVRGAEEPIDIYLSGNPRSMPQPFTELIRKGLAHGVFREDGGPSYGLMGEVVASLAEVLVNDGRDGYLIPSRKLREIENMKPSDWRGVYYGSSRGLPPDLQKRLDFVDEYLEEYLIMMWNERWDDPIALFEKYAMDVEKALATGSVEWAGGALKHLTRILFHVDNPMFLRDYPAHLSRRLDRLRGSGKHDKEYTDDLVKLEDAYFAERNFDFILKTASRFRQQEKWAVSHVSEEALELVDFWKRVAIIIDSILVADWQKADQQTLELEKKGRDQLAKNNFSHFYFEEMLFDFLADYWAQRDGRARTNKDTRDSIASVLALSQGDQPPTSDEIKSALGQLTSPQIHYMTDYERWILQAALSRWAMTLPLERRKEVPRLSKHKGHVVANPHKAFLLEMMMNFPLRKVSLNTVAGAFGLVGSGALSRRHFAQMMHRLGFPKSFVQVILMDLNDGLNWSSPKTEGANQTGIILPGLAVILLGLFSSLLAGGVMLGRRNIDILVSVISVDPLFLFAFLVTVFWGVWFISLAWGLANRFLAGSYEAREKDLVLANSFAVAFKKTEFMESGSDLNLGLAGQDLVRRVYIQDSRHFRGILKTILSKIGIPLDWAHVRYLMARLWGAEMIGDVTLFPEGPGVRPLTVLYLDERMVSGNTGSLLEQYSPKGGGALVLVPTDEGARAAVLVVPVTFKGLIFDSRGEGVPRVPGLAEVERRLERAGVNFGQYTGCRVVTPLGMVLDTEGVRSSLFREALVLLLNGLTGVLLKREDLHFIDRVTRAVNSSA
ncbi:MAG: hypothetical protein IPN90_09310 [Elusimicrobia bacterium]|nr:hypothetical protein [Elusimicrobiota bacterium]